jgi:uncharacterized protein (TIGR02466 family)
MSPSVSSLFATRIYGAPLGGPTCEPLLGELLQASLSIAEDDDAGQRWSEEHGYPGYTSYGSLSDLAWRDPSFKALVPHLDAHVVRYAEAAAFDLGERRLALDSLWINVLEPGGFHSGHIHPHSVVSGTLYLQTPEGASAIRFEDPRLPMMMAAPQRRRDAPPDLRTSHTVAAAAGQVLLWESWLRHEVPLNAADDLRVSVSFNYRW